jgi:hypothetical protein
LKWRGARATSLFSEASLAILAQHVVMPFRTFSPNGTPNPNSGRARSHSPRLARFSPCAELATHG